MPNTKLGVCSGACGAAGVVEGSAHPFPDHDDNPRAVAYPQTLRLPFLTRPRPPIPRVPDNPRRDQP